MKMCFQIWPLQATRNKTATPKALNLTSVAIVANLTSFIKSAVKIELEMLLEQKVK